MKKERRNTICRQENFLRGIRSAFLAALLLLAVLSCVIPVEQTMAGKVELNVTKLSLTVGSTKTIKLKNLGGDKKAKWSVSDKKVIRIKKKSAGKAVAEARKAGKATVTAKVGKKKYQCEITVKEKTDASAKPPKVNASEIWAKYDKDPDKYEPTYDGELVNATGVVNFIGEDSHGTPSMELADAKGGVSYVLGVFGSYGEMSAVSVGDTVTISGHFHIMSSENMVVIKNCKIKTIYKQKE